MKLIVGLGNIGGKYENTRHNVGFEVLNVLAERNSADTPRQKFEGQAAEAMIGGQKSLLLWPHTFMNRSGQSVWPAMDFFKLEHADLLVVCDDFNLNLGKLRFRTQGSSGGQNGLADIIAKLGTEGFSRLRLGIGPVPDRWDAADFVLGKIGKAERAAVTDSVILAADGVECWAAEGIAAAMNRFN